MIKLKAGRPTIEFIKLCYQAGLPPLLLGSHGVGKSQLVRQAAMELGIDSIERDLSLMEPPDLVGLPKTSGKSTIFLPPEFLPRSGKGILLFEELNRCPSYMTAPCLQLLTNRTLNDYRLPDGWIAAAAVNPDDDDYDVRTLDPALLSRFVKAQIVPDSKEWLRWANNAGVHRAVRKYVAADPTALDGRESNPRAWHYVSTVLRTLDQTDVLNGPARAMILGIVGDERGIAFLQSLKHEDRPLTAEAVLSTYATHRNQVAAWITNGQLDLVKATLLALKKHLQPQADYEAARADRQRFANLARFLDDLPGDLRADANDFFRERRYKIPTLGKASGSRRSTGGVK
jgi:MoxR-like ATPase